MRLRSKIRSLRLGQLEQKIDSVHASIRLMSDMVGLLTARTDAISAALTQGVSSTGDRLEAARSLVATGSALLLQQAEQQSAVVMDLETLLLRQTVLLSRIEAGLTELRSETATGRLNTDLGGSPDLGLADSILAGLDELPSHSSGWGNQ